MNNTVFPEDLILPCPQVSLVYIYTMVCIGIVLLNTGGMGNFLPDLEKYTIVALHFYFSNYALINIHDFVT